MRKKLLAIVVASALGITSLMPASPSPSHAQTATTIDMVFGDFSFSPAAIEVPAGIVTFNISNPDSLRHDIVITVNGVDLESDIYPAGQGGTWEVTLDQPGTYDFYCSIGNHREKGMVGTITVS